METRLWLREILTKTVTNCRIYYWPSFAGLSTSSGSNLVGGGTSSELLPRPIAPADDGCDLWSLPKIDVDAVADADAEAVAVKVAAAVAGRCNDVDADVDASSDAGCNMLRLVVAMPDAAEEWEAKAEYAEEEEAAAAAAAVSGTWPGMLAVTDAVVGFAGGAGNDSRLIVVVLGVAAAEALEAGMAYTELDPVSVMPSGPRTVAAAE